MSDGILLLFSFEDIFQEELKRIILDILDEDSFLVDLFSF